MGNLKIKNDLREKNKIYEDTGITLIALITTIIILLILSGISITMLAGENGIIQQATKAKEKMQEINEQERLQLACIAAISENSNIEKEELQLQIDNMFGKDYATVYDNGYTKVIQINDNTKRYYSIDTKGKLSKTGNAIEITPDDYGKRVNYGITYSNRKSVECDAKSWEIFYADSANVYLISTDCLPVMNFNGVISNYVAENKSSSLLLNDTKRFPAAQQWLYGYKKTTTKTWFESSNSNIRATLYLLDSENVWDKTYKNDFASWVIGGPTLELLIASINSKKSYDAEKNKTDYNCLTIPNVNENGYESLLTEIYSIENQSYWVASQEEFDDGVGIWLACPPSSDYRRQNFIYTKTRSITNEWVSVNEAIRPIVCLDKSTILTYNNDENYYDLSSVE